VGVFLKDYDKVMNDGFFQGYDHIVIMVVLTQASSSIFYALAIKYADTIVKSFATALSSILSTIFAFYIFEDSKPTW
jgi:UDP-sugar transporter A1/2/3